MASGIVILDDASGQITYSGGTWTLATDVQWYQASSYWPQFTDGVSKFGSFDLTFEGRSIAFIGNTPPDGLSQQATVSIDGGSTSTFDYGDPTPQTYMPWYQSPNLSDGQHRISIGHLAGTALDIALITIGPNTSLSGKTLLVDDNDSQISYSGSWARNTNKFDAGTLPDGFPIRGSTHRSSKAGDSITFRFSGTSVAVYGIFDWGNTGTLTATYNLDGRVGTQDYSVNSDTPNHVNDFGEASNFVFFRTGNLQAGPHTLVITITQSQNIAYNFDYITYTPSFSNLASRPNLDSLPLPSNNPPQTLNPTPATNGPPVTGGSSNSTPGPSSVNSSGSSPSGTAPTDSPNSPNPKNPNQNTSGSIVAGGFQPGPTINGAPSSSTANGESSKSPVAAIVGGVLGGLLLLVLLLTILVFARRRERKRKRDLDALNNENGATRAISPHSASLSPGGSISPFQSASTPSARYIAKFAQMQASPQSGSSLDSPHVSQETSSRGPGSSLSGGEGTHVMEVDAGPVTWPPAYHTIPGNARNTTPAAQPGNPFDDKEAV